MHQRFLNDYLMNVADVYLVSRLKDERLKFDVPSDFRLFLPDLHLIGKEREKRFNYSTNFPELLRDLLTQFIRFKTDSKAQNIEVTVSQLGDIMDLWREIPVSLSTSAATETLKNGTQTIIDDRAEILSRLLGPQLKAEHFLGNHDFELHNLPQFSGSSLSSYFPIAVEGPSAFAMHGDAFNMFERNMPEELKNLMVYAFGPLAKQGTVHLGQFRKESLKQLKIQDIDSNHFENYIQNLVQPDLKGLVPIDPLTDKGTEIFASDRFNVKRLGDPGITDNDTRYLKESKEFAAMINKQQNWKLSFSVIGHTHRARIALDDSQDFFALIDCGAWIEKCEGSGLVFPNAQLGVIYQNDARIYQLVPKGFKPLSK